MSKITDEARANSTCHLEVLVGQYDQEIIDILAVLDISGEINTGDRELISYVGKLAKDANSYEYEINKIRLWRRRPDDKAELI